MDEPLAALDRFARNDILPYLQRLHDHLAIPVLYVSHDIVEVERLADYMVFMEAGGVRAAGALKTLLADPALPFARAPEAAAVLDGTVTGHDQRYGLSTLSVAGARLVVPGDLGGPGSDYRLRIAASDVGLCRGPAPRGLSILNTPRARITGAEQLDNHQTHVFLKLGEGGEGAALMARITHKSWEGLALHPGETVTVLIKGVSLVETA
ncbi:MAG: TOBE domain-containing protein [Thiohalospira sp.]